MYGGTEMCQVYYNLREREGDIEIVRERRRKRRESERKTKRVNE